jgi:hypothetical protein
MNTSLRRLIPFLPLFCNCQLNSIPLLRSSCPGRLAFRNSTQFPSTEFFFITTLHGPRRKRNLSIVRKACLQRIRCCGDVFTESLPSNERLFLLHYSDFRTSCYNMIKPFAGPKPLATGIRDDISKFFKIIDSAIFKIILDKTQKCTLRANMQ